MRVEELDDPRKDRAVAPLRLVDALELGHLLERQPEDLELADELEAPDVVVGVHAGAALEPLHGVEEADLFVVADRALGHADLRGELADAIARRTRLVHCRPCHDRSPPRSTRGLPVHVNSQRTDIIPPAPSARWPGRATRGPRRPASRARWACGSRT